MIAMVATLKIKEGHEADFEAAAKQLAAAVQANEPGNHLYQLCKGSEPQTYYFVERYESEEALAAHGASAHMKEHGGAMAPHMAGRPEILKLEEV
jgi:quinol monooxygenase YgiN